MDIVGGAYGGSDPQAELRADLETAKGWLETAMSAWEGVSEERRLEMVASALLSLHRLSMSLDTLKSATQPAPDHVGGLRVHVGPDRPSLVDLRVEERMGEAAARVKLLFRNQALVGESTFDPAAARDHAAPARATLEALQSLVEEPLRLEDARVLQILDGPFAVVTLRSEARLLVGSALIEDDLGVAIARATLDAANRFINGAPNDERTIQLTE